MKNTIPLSGTMRAKGLRSRHAVVMSLLMFALALLWQTSVFAQVALLPLYQNGRVTGTYSEISGGVLLGTTTSDDQVFVDPAVPAGTGSGATGVGFPIGFDFTFNGVTKPLAIDAVLIGEGDDPWGGYRAGFTGTTTFKMKDYGMKMDLGPASANVELELVVEGIKK